MADNKQEYIIKVYDNLYLHFYSLRDNTFQLTRDINGARTFTNIKDALVTKDSMDNLAKAKGEYPLPKVEIITIQNK